MFQINMKKNLTLNFQRILSLLVVLFGAGASLSLTLHAGQHNKSILLVALFLAWVLSPYIAMLLAYDASKRWTTIKQEILYILMVVVTFGSLVCYSGILTPLETKPAFIFLVVPLISWLLLSITILIASILSKNLFRRNKSV